MSTNEKYVTKEILGYYDSKIKEYIEDKVKETEADSADPKELERRLDAVETLSAVNRDDIVEAEAAILTLQEDDKKITAAIAQKANKEDIPSIDGLATEEYVLTKIAEAELSDKDVDLSQYYTKSETDAKISDSIKNFVTSEEFERVQQQSANNEIKLIQLDSDLFDIKKQIEEIPTPDLTSYATKEELSAVEAKIPSIDDLATKQELEDAIQNIEHPTVNLDGYATEYYVDNKFAQIKVPSKVSELENDTEYVTAKDIPDVSNFVTQEYVTENYVTNNYIQQNYTTNDQLAATYVTKETVTQVVTKEVDTVVTEHIETKVTEIIDDKIESGDIVVKTDSIGYDNF